MKLIIGYLKRNSAVFILGFLILALFIVIIITGQKPKGTAPEFIKVEEQIFDEREPKSPSETGTGNLDNIENVIEEYASQIPSTENIGKPYFYGEENPLLRDKDGYPRPPEPGLYKSSTEKYPELIAMQKDAEEEEYQRRMQVYYIEFGQGGFNPTDGIAYTGQRVVWVNKSTSDITISQAIFVHEALRDGFTLKPGESYEFRPLVNGRVALVEETTGKYSTLYIMDVTSPLVTE